jgi:G3E family GTPase
MERAAPHRVPVLVVTGYAAAGKTWLVNCLLASCERKHIMAGVIMHRQAEEFGIQTHGLADGAAAFSETVYDFGSGCICCSPKGELTRLLTEIEHRLAGGLHLDLLILRLGPLAAPLIFCRAVCDTERFEVASIVAIVDPILASRHLATEGDEWQARAQIACADLVLLNARSQGSNSISMSEACAAAEALVSSVPEHKGGLCPPVERMALPSGEALIERLLLRRACFSRERAALVDPSGCWLPAADGSDCSGGGGGSGAVLLSLSAHDRRLAAGCAVEDGPLHWHKLKELCERLVASGTVLRMKGVVHIFGDINDGNQGSEQDGGRGAGDEEEGPAAVTIHTVHIEGVEDLAHLRFDFRSQPPKASGGEHGDDGRSGDRGASSSAMSKLFVLGRGLAIGSLRRDFQFCRVPVGYAFAADAELHFVPRLTAASTTKSGVAPRLRAVASDLPGVTIICVNGDECSNETARESGSGGGGKSDEHYIALARKPSGTPEEIQVFDDEQHGVCVRFVPSSTAGGEAVAAYRVSDGAVLPSSSSSVSPLEDKLPVEEAAQAREYDALRRLPVVIVDGAIYVRV